VDASDGYQNSRVENLVPNAVLCKGTRFFNGGGYDVQAFGMLNIGGGFSFIDATKRGRTYTVSQQTARHDLNPPTAPSFEINNVRGPGAQQIWTPYWGRCRRRTRIGFGVGAATRQPGQVKVNDSQRE